MRARITADAPACRYAISRASAIAASRAAAAAHYGANEAAWKAFIAT
jgi:hypothetical protein